MQVAEPPLRDWDRLEGGPRLPRGLGKLEGHTVPAPGSDVRIHGKPEEMCSSQPLRGMYTKMSLAVYGPEDELVIFS